ncbi:MAG: hypothetical protein ACOYNN_04190 [Terrimicrobiaceae bacterium]
MKLDDLKIRTAGLILPARWNALVDAVQSAMITAFAGGTFARTAGGTTLWSRGRPGGDASSAHPFQVISRTVDGDLEYGVIYTSSLFKSLQPNDKQAITGLLSEDQTTGWFSLTSGGYIWLGITFDSTGAITTAAIDNSDTETFDLTQPAWSGNDGYCEDDGETEPTHQTSRKLIAYIVAGDPSPVLHQVMFHDQLLRNTCVDGRPARYPFDHEGGYPL